MSSPFSDLDPFGNQSSGDTSFRMSTSDIVQEAFDICQVGVEEDDIDPEMYKRAVRSLNLLVSAWQAQGIHLWTYQEATLFLEAGKGKYTLEQSHAVNSDKYTLTNSQADIAAGSTVFNINTTIQTDNANTETVLDFGWRIGFMQSDNNIFWTTVQAVDVDEVTITDQTPEDFTTDTQIIFYEKPLSSVERVLDVRRLQGLFGGFENETPINLISHDKFMRQPNKTITGTVNQCTYDRVLSQGVLRTWPSALNSSEQITLTYERMIDNFFEVDNCADIPRYYLEALCYGLADRLGIKFRVNPQLQQEIKARAYECLQEALSFDNANYEISVDINGGA